MWPIWPLKTLALRKTTLSGSTVLSTHVTEEGGTGPPLRGGGVSRRARSARICPGAETEQRSDRREERKQKREREKKTAEEREREK